MEYIDNFWKQLILKIKTGTFLQLEIGALISILILISFVGYTSLKRIHYDIQDINKKVISIENNVIKTNVEFGKYMGYDSWAYVNYKIVDINTYKSNADSFSSFLNHAGLTNIDSINNIIENKTDILNQYVNILKNNKLPKKVYNKVIKTTYAQVKEKKLLVLNTYTIDTSYKISYVENKVEYQNQVINQRNVQDSLVRHIMVQRMYLNLQLSDILHRYVDSLLKNDEVVLGKLNNDIKYKLDKMELIYLILIPLFLFTVVLVIADVKKLFKRNIVKESFIETLIKIKKED